MKPPLLPLIVGLCLALASGTASAQATGSPLKPELLHSFTAGITDFYNGVIVGPGGDFFGVSRLGGKFNNGTFFKVDGSGVVTKLADFGDPNSEARGRHPSGRLVYDGTTYFYGVTSDGGPDDRGTIFRVDVLGQVETLVVFTGHEGVAPGSSPESGLTLGPDGNFYGVAYAGVQSNGVIYRVSPGGRYQVVLEFTGERGAAPGDGPSSPLLVLPDGSFVGTTSSGGRLRHGVVFRFSLQTGYSVVGEFTGNAGALQGSNPRGELVRGLDGSIYGFVYSNTDFGQRIWKLPPTGSAQPFVSLKTDANGQTFNVYTPSLGVLASGDLIALADSVEAYGYYRGFMRITPAGSIYPFEDLSSIGYANFDFSIGNSTALIDDGTGGLLANFGPRLLRRPSSGPTTVLATTNPDAGTGDGLWATGKILVAADGTVFGTTVRGGTNDQGTIFKLPTTGPLTTLVSIQNNGGYYYYEDGVNSYGDNQNSLIFSGSDLLHLEPNSGMTGQGIVLRITPAGSVSTMADFSAATSVPASGTLGFPRGGLAADGTGTTFYGRAQYYDSTTTNYQDAIYRLTSGGQIEFIGSVPSFGGSNYSSGPLTFDGVANFFGVQPGGGNKYDGLIFKVTPAGQITKFFEFGQPGDTTKSASPSGPFLREPSGSFIIPTASSNGGDFSSSLIRLPPSGPPTQILGFTGTDGPAFGYQPIAPLVRDAVGRIYGVTSRDGRDNNGVLYRLETNGAYTLLHEFTTGDGATDVGTRPGTGLTLSPDGTTIYGGTFSGGPNGGGTIFRFPTSVQATATTGATTDITANSATYHATLDSNGYGGSFFFRFGESAGTLDRQTSVQAFSGFNGSQAFDLSFTELKGHRTYYVQFNTSVGVGPDIITRQGSTESFATPNGAPRVADDTIIVTSADGGTTGEVLANDVEPDDDTPSVESFTPPTYGTVTRSALDPNKLVYTPSPAFFDPGQGNGRDSFTYTVTDGFTGAGGPLTATATVEVLSDASLIGAYAGLLFEADLGTSAIPRDAVALPSPDQIAAGFASIALGSKRKFSARFQIGGQSVAVKGTMSEGRGTPIRQPRSRFDGELRPTPGGVEGRITINGRTLILRTGQAFAAAQGVQRPVSDFTMRFSPDKIEDPVNAKGVPAGSGFAVVRELKGSRVRLVGVLPDGTAFSQGTVVNGNKEMDFFTPLYKGKIGSLGGKFTFADNGEIDAAVGTSTLWKKGRKPGDTRFAEGFETKMTGYGGKYAVPVKGKPPLTVDNGKKLEAKFDRGGLFREHGTKFTFTGSKPVADPNNDTARAKVKFSARTGAVSGTFVPGKKPVKYVGLVIQRDQSVAGFFLGTGDTGSVKMEVVP